MIGLGRCSTLYMKASSTDDTWLMVIEEVNMPTRYLFTSECHTSFFVRNMAIRNLKLQAFVGGRL